MSLYFLCLGLSQGDQQIGRLLDVFLNISQALNNIRTAQELFRPTAKLQPEQVVVFMRYIFRGSGQLGFKEEIANVFLPRASILGNFGSQILCLFIRGWQLTSMNRS
jgi:hypothetical protein